MNPIGATSALESPCSFDLLPDTINQDAPSEIVSDNMALDISVSSPRDLDDPTTMKGKDQNESTGENKIEFQVGSLNPVIQPLSRPNSGISNVSAVPTHTKDTFVDFRNTEIKEETFTCFPELPLELQRKIWRVVANFPRILSFTESVNVMPGSNDAGVVGLNIQKSCSPQPSILAVCHESRKEAKLHYALIFGVQMFLRTLNLSGPLQHLSIKGKIYFNRYADTIYLSEKFSAYGNDLLPFNALYHTMMLKPWNVVKSLAFHIDLYFDRQEDIPIFKYGITRFISLRQNLEEIILVIGTVESQFPRLYDTPRTGEIEFIAPAADADTTAAEVAIRGLEKSRKLYEGRMAKAIPSRAVKWPSVRVAVLVKSGSRL